MIREIVKRAMGHILKYKLHEGEETRSSYGKKRRNSEEFYIKYPQESVFYWKPNHPFVFYMWVVASKNDASPVSTQWMMDRTGHSRRQVLRHLKVCIKLGFMKRVTSGTKKIGGKPNTFYMPLVKPSELTRRLESRDTTSTYHAHLSDANKVNQNTDNRDLDSCLKNNPISASNESSQETVPSKCHGVTQVMGAMCHLPSRYNTTERTIIIERGYAPEILDEIMGQVSGVDDVGDLPTAEFRRRVKDSELFTIFNHIASPDRTPEVDGYAEWQGLWAKLNGPGFARGLVRIASAVEDKSQLPAFSGEALSVYWQRVTNENKNNNKRRLETLAEKLTVATHSEQEDRKIRSEIEITLDKQKLIRDLQTASKLQNYKIYDSDLPFTTRAIVLENMNCPDLVRMLFDKNESDILQEIAASKELRDLAVKNLDQYLDGNKVECLFKLYISKLEEEVNNIHNPAWKPKSLIMR